MADTTKTRRDATNDVEMERRAGSRTTSAARAGTHRYHGHDDGGSKGRTACERVKTAVLDRSGSRQEPHQAWPPLLQGPVGPACFRQVGSVRAGAGGGGGGGSG